MAQKPDEKAVLDAIAKMEPAAYRAIGEKLHKIIRENAPDLMPRTWYGMPAYSNGSRVICFFRGSEKFGERYLTLGFNPDAHLDDGTMWPIVYAITELDDSHEAKVAALVKKAVS